MQCKNNSLYTGITTDVERRFKEHKEKKGGKYTRGHAVEKVVYTEEMPTRSDALRREAEIKSWRHDKKIQLIKQYQLNSLKEKKGRVPF